MLFKLANPIIIIGVEVMDNMLKSLTCQFLLSTLGVGLFLVISTNFCVVVQASTGINEIPKPSVPEFTLKFVDNSYDVPPTYSIDPFTGKNVTHDGYHVKKQSIEVRIKNQPFTPVYDENGALIVGLYYNIRFKGHYGDEWRYYPYDPDNGYTIFSYSATYETSQSDYIILSLRPNIDTSGGIRLDVPEGGQVDFQMQGLTGHVDKIYTGMTGLWWVGGEMDHYYVFTGKTSDWSSTQTFTFENEPIPEFPSWTPLLVMLVAAMVVIVFYKRRLENTN